MALNFHPGYGKLLYCDFGHQTEPEMVKVRPVVVVSRSHNKLCTVVPLSGTEPDPVKAWHYKMNRLKLPQRMHGNEWWAKCDCLTTVAFFRLDRCFVGKCPHTGKRLYDAPTITSEDLEGIKTAITKHLAIAVLISP